MPIKAVFFDIDGTLVDSNDLHVEAWIEAFETIGVRLDRRVIRQQIGKGTDKLVPALLPDVDDRTIDALGKVHGTVFQARYLSQVQAFPRAHDLLARVRDDGKQVVLASSASRAERDYYTAFLDATGIVAHGTTADEPPGITKPRFARQLLDRVDDKTMLHRLIADYNGRCDDLLRKHIISIRIDGSLPESAAQPASCPSSNTLRRPSDDNDPIIETEANAAVLTLWKNGVPIKQIVRCTGHHRGTVRRMIRGERRDVFRSRQSSLEAYLPWLDGQWDAGARNAAALSRGLRERGFRGSARVVTEWATRRRRAEKADAQSLTRVPSSRTIARLLTTGRASLSKSESVMIAAIEEGLPTLVDAREIIADFHDMVRRKAVTSLSSWIERACQSLVASFGNGVRKDEAAVLAAITSPWSNGQTEGQVTRLKLVKRQMYGRAKIDLLQARLIGAA